MPLPLLHGRATAWVSQDLLGNASYMAHTLGATRSFFSQIPVSNAVDISLFSQVGLPFIDFLSVRPPSEPCRG